MIKAWFAPSPQCPRSAPPAPPRSPAAHPPRAAPAPVSSSSGPAVSFANSRGANGSASQPLASGELRPRHKVRQTGCPAPGGGEDRGRFPSTRVPRSLRKRSHAAPLSPTGYGPPARRGGTTQRRGPHRMQLRPARCCSDREGARRAGVSGRSASWSGFAARATRPRG
jgi:hypothetical protein